MIFSYKCIQVNNPLFDPTKKAFLKRRLNRHSSRKMMLGKRYMVMHCICRGSRLIRVAEATVSSTFISKIISSSLLSMILQNT